MQIVGESYYWWDSVSTYLPTLCLVFCEINVEQGPRRTQIKVRLKEKNEEVGDAEINRLRSSCAALSSLTDTYGIVRANYVNHDKWFKTTVFCADPPNVERVLQPICGVIGDPYDDRNLSLPTARESPNYRKRTTSLADVPINTVNYHTTVVVKFYKVGLLINELSLPIVLFKATS
ncbi:hypothetical protein COCOBI_pt-0960 (chloroplast) [Coccomyxa sp. Obi]|nr:hypothetical protein COCOBI_pt-0960 [Coccomyxa sp. Obi]